MRAMVISTGISTGILTTLILSGSVYAECNFKTVTEGGKTHVTREGALEIEQAVIGASTAVKLKVLSACVSEKPELFSAYQINAMAVDVFPLASEDDQRTNFVQHAYTLPMIEKNMISAEDVKTILSFHTYANEQRISDRARAEILDAYIHKNAATMTGADLGEFFLGISNRIDQSLTAWQSALTTDDKQKADLQLDALKQSNDMLVSHYVQERLASGTMTSWDVISAGYTLKASDQSQTRLRLFNNFYEANKDKASIAELTVLKNEAIKEKDSGALVDTIVTQCGELFCSGVGHPKPTTVPATDPATQAVSEAPNADMRSQATAP